MDEVMDEELNTQGWDAISETFGRLYPDQDEPLHFGTLISWRLGGDDPLDGISIYDGGAFWHFVTYGFSELYEKESEEAEYSGYGFELTVKLKKTAGTAAVPEGDSADNEEIRCMAGVLQALGRYSFEEGQVFHPYEYIYTGQRSGMDAKGESPITGFITVPDEAGEIETPNGRVQFVQLVGVTDGELKAIIDKRMTVVEMAELLGHTLTDYGRGELTGNGVQQEAPAADGQQ